MELKDSFVSITWSDDGEKWNEKPIRYVIERTCKRIDSPNDDEGRPNLPTCSECGEELSYTDRYCPNCGAKVVKE